MLDIFVSYSKRDRSCAQELAAILEDSGYTVWRDAELLAGTAFRKTVYEAEQSARWMSACVCVKKSANRLKSGPQRRPRAGGDPYKSLFQLDKWIPAFAGMTLRSHPEARKLDFFTRSYAGVTVCGLTSIENAQAVPAQRVCASGRPRNAAGLQAGAQPSKTWVDPPLENAEQ